MNNEQQFINFIAQKLQHIEMHVDTIARISRYKLWQELKEESRKKFDFNQHGFRVTSQNDQDGIIENIFNILECEEAKNSVRYNKETDIINKVFVEFGSDNGVGNNSHYLLIKNWKGLWFDAKMEHHAYIQNNFSNYLSKGRLKSYYEFLTKDNINERIKFGLTSLLGFGHNIIPDIIIIDTDWNDYYLWEALEIKPKVVCIEYNAHIPPPNKIVVPYTENTNEMWDGSNCFGASYQALVDLGKEKGYFPLTCSLAGTDIFFVDKKYKHLFEFKDKNSMSYKDYVCYYQPPRFNLEFNLGHTLMTPGRWQINE